MSKMERYNSSLPAYQGDMALYKDSMCDREQMARMQAEAFKNYGVVALDTVNMSPTKGVLKVTDTVGGSSKVVSFTYDLTDVGITADQTLFIGLPLAGGADSIVEYATVYGAPKIDALVKDNEGAGVPKTRRWSDCITANPVTLTRIFVQSSSDTQLAEPIEIVKLAPDGTIQKKITNIATAVDASFNLENARQLDNVAGDLTFGEGVFLKYRLKDNAIVTLNFYLESASTIRAFNGIK